MFSASVNPGKGLFMQKTDKMVLSGDSLHELHYYLVVVCSYVHGCKIWGYLMLGRSRLIELCHEFLNSRFYCSGVVIIKLLTFRRLCAEKGSSCIQKVLAFGIHLLVNKEIFLFCTYINFDRSDIISPEQLHKSEALAV